MDVQRGTEGEGERDKDGGGGHTENSVPEAEEIPSNHVRQNEISGAAGQGCSGVEMVLHGGREDGGKFSQKRFLRESTASGRPWSLYCCGYRVNWKRGRGALTKSEYYTLPHLESLERTL